MSLYLANRIVVSAGLISGFGLNTIPSHFVGSRSVFGHNIPARLQPPLSERFCWLAWSLNRNYAFVVLVWLSYALCRGSKLGRPNQLQLLVHPGEYFWSYTAHIVKLMSDEQLFPLFNRTSGDFVQLVFTAVTFCLYDIIFLPAQTNISHD